MPPWPPPIFRSGYRQRNAGNAFEFRQQRILKSRIARGGMRLQTALVMPITAGNAGPRIFAGDQPLLRQVPQAQIAGRIFAAHLGRHPAGIDRATDHAWPTPATAAASAVTHSLLSE